MNADELKMLERVESLLGYGTDTSHYCEEENCTIQTPKCHDMHNLAALAMLRDALEPPHRSLQPSRTANEAERIFASRWIKENERRCGINHGYTGLEWILCPDGQRAPQRVSHRDAAVAASVIQWFGTSCGYAFLLGCEQAVAAAKALRAAYRPDDYVLHNIEPPPEDLAIAEQLAGPVRTHPAHHDIVRGIVAALVHARKTAITAALEAAQKGSLV